MIILCTSTHLNPTCKEIWLISIKIINTQKLHFLDLSRKKERFMRLVKKMGDF